MNNDFVDDPARQCDGKLAWHTKANAKRALKRFRMSYPGQSREHLKPYRCPHCGAFHLGTKPQFSYLKGPR
jgi:hypothetical protein